ncbi:hypothetical protein T265_12282 [Opisthorchis viverrini]|uniref:Uncharacterized protein n=1 Tax=Opisthorchis viverrini TaxID=6198 RepID=A0A074YYY2_OPIVI|nr:hypothetical protein T265_12282 [Opisthorchis viverrini]KER18412.1 hypothetical protein T265_12282 [Opisthorchis viverrini]
MSSHFNHLTILSSITRFRLTARAYPTRLFIFSCRLRFKPLAIRFHPFYYRSSISPIPLSDCPLSPIYPHLLLSSFRSSPQPNTNPVILDFQEEVNPRDVICSPPVAVLSCSDSMEFLEEYDDRENPGAVADVAQMRSSQLQCDSSTSKLATPSRLTSQAVQNPLPVRLV